MTEDSSHEVGRIGSFQTVLADPPWGIEAHKDALAHYNLLSMKRIAALPVGDVAAPDAHLWLWVTNATLRAGFSVVESWGFTVRSLLTWVKPRLGLGIYLRNATEHLMFGTRGKAPVRFRSQPTWLFAPVQNHSHKPEEQYALIERVSPGPYLELFARRRPLSNSNWSVWGNQIESDIEIPGYPVPRYRSTSPEQQSDDSPESS